MAPRHALAAIAAAAALAAPVAPAAGQPAPAASAPVEAVRAVIAAPITAARDLLAAGRFKEALTKVAEAEAVPDRTPYENFILDQLRGGAAAGAGDIDTAVRSFESALATGRLHGEEAARIEEGMVRAAAGKRDFANVIRWGERYAKDGGTNTMVRRQVALARYQTADFAGAAKEAEALVAADEAAGHRPPEDLVRLLGAAQLKMPDEAGYVRTLERLLAAYPKPGYWRDRIARVQAAKDFDDAALIDSYRLLDAVGGTEAAAEYVTHAELALRAGLPAEAKRVLDAGAAAGKVGTGGEAAAQNALRDRADRAAAADAASLSTAPAANASAAALVGQGLALAGAGRAAQGAPLVQQGVAKGGIPKPELAQLRLGWVLAQAGQTEAARAAFKAVAGAGGGIGDLARLWLIHLDRPAAAPKS